MSPTPSHKMCFFPNRGQICVLWTFYPVEMYADVLVSGRQLAYFLPSHFGAVWASLERILPPPPRALNTFKMWFDSISLVCFWLFLKCNFKFPMIQLAVHWFLWPLLWIKLSDVFSRDNRGNSSADCMESNQWGFIHWPPQLIHKWLAVSI